MNEFSAASVTRHSSIVNRHSRTPLVFIVLSFLLGIGSSLVFKQHSFTTLAVADAALIWAALLALREDRRTLSLLLGLSAISTGGLLMTLARRDGIPIYDLRSLLSRNAFPLNESVSFEGCVLEESEKRSHAIVTTVELHAFLQKELWVRCGGKGIVWMPEPTAENVQVQGVALKCGDRVRGWATWRIPSNYQNPGSADRVGWLARRGIFLIGRIKSPRLIEVFPGVCGNSWARMANVVRE